MATITVPKRLGLFLIVAPFFLISKLFAVSPRIDITKHIKNISTFGSLKAVSPPSYKPSSPFSVSVVNTDSDSWGSVSILFLEPLDLSHTPLLELRLRGHHGGERLEAHLRDAAWKHSDVIQANSAVLPAEGLSAFWQKLVIDLTKLEGEIDLKRVTRLNLELGSDTVGNEAGMGIDIQGMVCRPKWKALVQAQPAPTPETPPAALPEAPSPAIETMPQAAAPVEETPPPAQNLVPQSRLETRWSLPSADFPNSLNLKRIAILGFGLLFLGSCLSWANGLRRKTSSRPSVPPSAQVLTPVSSAPPSKGLLFGPLLDRRQKSRRTSMPDLGSQPISVIYEINTRVWGASRLTDGKIRLRKFSQISNDEIKKIKAMGFDTIWMMGIWETSPKAHDISKRYGHEAGSPYAIPAYRINPDLGGPEEFTAFCDRSHKLGLKVLVDFVPNHTSVDSDYLKNNPEFFIHRTLSWEEEHLSDEELANRYPDYFVHNSDRYPEGGRRTRKRILVAYGRDPYSIPWIDTAQLDLSHPNLRHAMTEVLLHWAQHVDGVRCDMAMLVLRDQIKQMWHPHLSWDYFNRLVPEEFWSELISTIKEQKPGFVFLAESYWAKEGYLQHLGFDFTYDKALYDILREIVHGGSPQNLMHYLQNLDQNFLSRGCHFLENHDEERAMNAFGVAAQKAAATLIGAIPGVPLFHQGQFEGKREKLPVQRIIPQNQEIDNQDLMAFYRRLIPLISAPVFRQGTMTYLFSTNSNLVAFARSHEDEKCLVIVNLTGGLQSGTFHLPGDDWSLNGNAVCFEDLYYLLKDPAAKARATVKPSYIYRSETLKSQGLYVELGPFDAHVFRVKKLERTVVARFKSLLALS